MQIQLNNHTFQIDPGKNEHLWLGIQNNQWEPHSFAIFDYFIDVNSVVLDIGAWSGVLTLYAAKTAKEVHAIDPDPVCFEELNANVQLNPKIAGKIKTYQTAISGEKETVQLSARESYGASSSSILKRKRDTEKSHTLETVSLMDFLKEAQISHVDFIKMDVEGAEFKMISTLSNALKFVAYPTLYISFHYHFFNEYLCQKYIPSAFLNKLFLRLEAMFGFSLFKKKIQKELKPLFEQLGVYKYVYKTDGTRISFETLQKHPELIKATDLVFTNNEWQQK